MSFKDSNLRAFADVTVDGLVTIKGVKVIDGKNGLFASMPSVKDRNDEYQSVCTIAKDHWQEFNDILVADYGEALKREQEESENPTEEPEPEADPEPSQEQTM